MTPWIAWGCRWRPRSCAVENSHPRASGPLPGQALATAGQVREFGGHPALAIADRVPFTGQVGEQFVVDGVDRLGPLGEDRHEFPAVLGGRDVDLAPPRSASSGAVGVDCVSQSTPRVRR